MTKTIFCLLLAHYHLYCYEEHANCSPFASTDAGQTVAPMPNCICMMTWSGVAHSGKIANYTYILSALSDYLSRWIAYLHQLLSKQTI